MVSAGAHSYGLVRQAPGLLRGPCVRFLSVVCGDECVVIVEVWCLAEAAVLGVLADGEGLVQEPRARLGCAWVHWLHFGQPGRR